MRFLHNRGQRSESTVTAPPLGALTDFAGKGRALRGQQQLVGAPCLCQTTVMISVVMPTLNSEATLARAMAALVRPLVDGVVKELIIADGGSSDRTCDIAEQAGATVVRAERGRGSQLKAGADVALGEWLLFLHADTVLAPGWSEEADAVIAKVESGHRPPLACVFRFALDDEGFAPRCLEWVVHWRSKIFRLPYGDQGLLVPRSLYQDVGGFHPMALMEDVDFIRRLGRRRIHQLRSEALTSAERYRRDGYLKRIIRNQACLALYYMRVPPDRLAALYAPEQLTASKQA